MTPTEWTIDDISAALAISDRAAQLRASKEGWQGMAKKVRGGCRHVYVFDLLPAPVQAELTKRTADPIVPLPATPAGLAGYDSGSRLLVDQLASAQARLDAKEQGLCGYSELPRTRQTEADARFDILQARDAFLRTTGLPVKRGTAQFCTELAAGTVKLPAQVIRAVAIRKGKISLSWNTVNRWHQAFSAHGMAGLAGQYKTKAKTNIPKHMCEFIVAMLVEHPHSQTPHIRAGLAARFDGQAIPHRAAIRRFVKAWKQEEKSVFKYIENPDQWKNDHMLAMGDASEQVERLNQVWEFDGTPTDVMLIDGRHTIIGVIDIYSRRLKLLISPTNKAEAVAALTRRAMLDWGVPEIAKTDNGSDYVSKHMVRVFDSLEIKQVLCPPFTPENKPHIERSFRTFAHGICELLPGYVGHNITDRKAIEARRTFAQRLTKQGSDPIDVKMTSDEFQTLCNRWCRAIYHQAPHSNLGGKKPAEMAREWTRPVRKIRDERALDILLSPTPGGDGLRVVGKKGLKVDNGKYFADELISYEGQNVRVLIDRTDFGAVYCFAEDGHFLCRAVDPVRAGMDRAEMASRWKQKQKKTMAKRSAELKKMSRGQKVKFIAGEILAHNEAKLANVVDLPRDSTPYTTGALDEMAKAVDDARRKAVGPAPAGLTDDQERRANEVIDLAAAKQTKGMPASEMECFQMLCDERDAGNDMTENEINWIADYDNYLITGEKTGLHAAGFQPFAERYRAAVKSSYSDISN
jgi:hypothetical protein